MWRNEVDSAVRALCADSLAQGVARCTALAGGDTLFLWGDQTRRAAGFIKVHAATGAAQDSVARAAETRVSTLLGPAIVCGDRIRAWHAGPTTALLVRRPDAVLVVLGNDRQAVAICPALDE
jgi:hypothetical protein